MLRTQKVKGMRTIQWSLLSNVAVLVSLLLIISCSQEDEVFTGPFLIKDGVTYDQDTNEPINGIALSTFGDDQSGIELKKKTAFKNGRKNGLEELFHQDGKLASRIRYKDGVKDGPLETYWPSGQLYTRVSYIAGKESGLYERFYSNGQLMIRQNYEDGVLHGVFEDFNQNGDLIQTAVYEKGVKIE
jgi:antitoxin component YwqK of YwqJK toxin-antitoxin module